MLIIQAINQYYTCVHTSGFTRSSDTWRQRNLGVAVALRGGGSMGIPTGKAPNTTSPSPSNTLYIIKTCLEASWGRGEVIKSCVWFQTLYSVSRAVFRSSNFREKPPEEEPEEQNKAGDTSLLKN